MLTIPLSPVPSQILQVVLSDQNCQLNIYYKNGNLFADVAVGDVNIVTAVICREQGLLICRRYAGFLGNLFFIDTKGNDDPNYLELGTRFQLIYISEEENAILHQ